MDFVAAGINRFRASWQVLHILHSFWRVTETTKSVHTFLKTPCAFGVACAIADITPEKLEEYMLTSEREGRPVSLQRLQAGNTPACWAFFSVHCACRRLI